MNKSLPMEQIKGIITHYAKQMQNTTKEYQSDTLSCNSKYYVNLVLHDMKSST
jgi:hypothetical protein